MRTVEINSQTNQVQPEVKVHVIIDNSESMIKEQGQLGMGMGQLVTSLANRANVSFEVRTMSANDDISAAGAKPTHTQSASYYTLDSTGNQVMLPGAPSTSSGPDQYYSTRHFGLGASLTGDPIRLSVGMTNAQVDAAKTALSSTVTNVGISQDADEDGICAMSRILADPGKFAAGDKAAFLLISDDNDQSDDSRCSKDRVSEKYALTGSSPYKHYTTSMTGTTAGRPGTYNIWYSYESSTKRAMGTFPQGAFYTEVSYDLPSRHTVTYRFTEGPWVYDEAITLDESFSGNCVGNATIASKLSGNNGQPLISCVVTETPIHKSKTDEIWHPEAYGLSLNSPGPVGVRQACSWNMANAATEPGALNVDCKYYFDYAARILDMSVTTSLPGGSPCSADTALMLQIRDRYSIPASILDSQISCTLLSQGGSSSTYIFDNQAYEYGLVPESTSCSSALIEYLRTISGGNAITSCSYNYTAPVPSVSVTANCRYDDSPLNFSTDQCANNGAGLMNILKSNFYLACTAPAEGYASNWTSVSGCQSSTKYSGTTSYVAQPGTAQVSSIKQALVPGAPASMSLSQAFATRANQLFGKNFLFASVIHNGTLSGGCPAGDPIAIGQTYIDLGALLSGQSQVTPICNPDYGGALTALQNFIDSVTSNSYPMPAMQPGEHLIGIRIRRGTQIIPAAIPGDVTISGSTLTFRSGFLQAGDVVLVDIST